jgi:hypothetical protein
MVVQWGAGAQLSAVGAALEWAAQCATPAPGMGTPAPGTATLAPGMGTPAPGTATLAPGAGTLAPGTGMATGITIITDFLSGSSRIGIQDGGIMVDGDIMITDTHIIRIMGTTIPIIITPTVPTTRATTGRRAFRR